MAGRRVLVLGAGSSGEHFVGALRRLDENAEITIVERGLAGGECSYYACMPSKGLLRPGELLAEARRIPGVREAVTGGLDAQAVLRRRDEIIHNLDDLKPPYDAVVSQVTNGGGGMPAFGDSLSEEQIQDVAAYVSSATQG